MTVEELAVVMPVYNEEVAIERVIEKWTNALNEIGIESFRIHAYNDGSKDNTLHILSETALDNRFLVVHNKENSGHGPTILRAYREHAHKSWIFQTDSDDEMGPEYFRQLWDNRNNYDFLIGKRDERAQSFSRKTISLISRITVRLVYGNGVEDVNSPYRLMRVDKLREIFDSIPEKTFAPNVIVSGMVNLMRLRVYQFPVPHQNRRSGEVSIRRLNLLRAACKSFVQTVIYRLVYAKRLDQQNDKLSHFSSM